VLFAVGYSAYEVAPATLTATFLTSGPESRPTKSSRSTIAALSHRNGFSAFPWARADFSEAIAEHVSSAVCRRPRFAGCSALIACLVALRYLQTAGEQTGASPKQSTAVAATN
jgi:hypothetical protein